MPKFQKKITKAEIEDVMDASAEVAQADGKSVEQVQAEEIAALRAQLEALELAKADVPTEVVSAPSKGSQDAQAIAAAIVGAVSEMGPRRFVPFGKEKITNPFNKSGRRERKLHKQCYQNGYRMPVELLFDEEIALLAQIKPGRYIDGLVTVTDIDDVDGGKLNIGYKNKTADQRMALGGRLTGVGKTGFERMLRMIVQEHKDREAAMKAARRQEVREALEDEA